MAEQRDSSDRGWSHFPHSADIGVEGWGPTLALAFEQAALALTAAVTSAKVQPVARVEIVGNAPDRELLFVEWLNAIIYEMAIRKMVFGRFEVSITDGQFRGRLWGEAIDTARHEPACEPKGATYTALCVSQSENGVWSARCVVDV